MVWDSIYRVIGETSKRHEDQLLMKDGSVMNQDESVRYLACSFFPDDIAKDDNQEHQLTRSVASTSGNALPDDTQDPLFTEAELKYAINSFNPKKAPGLDDLTADICRLAIYTNIQMFLPITNKCLELACFKHNGRKTMEEGRHRCTKEAW